MMLSVYLVYFEHSQSCRSFTQTEVNFFMATLNDERAWPVQWRQTTRRTGASWCVRLETQAYIDAAVGSTGDDVAALSVTFMLKRPRLTLFSFDNWLQRPRAAMAFVTQMDYRRYLVLHECGHALGLGHPNQLARGRAGVPAPVMLQQTRGFMGYAPNPWPLSLEADAVLRLRRPRPSRRLKTKRTNDSVPSA